jgi:hypothetical protein
MSKLSEFTEQLTVLALIEVVSQVILREELETIIVEVRTDNIEYLVNPEGEDFVEWPDSSSLQIAFALARLGSSVENAMWAIAKSTRKSMTSCTRDWTRPCGLSLKDNAGNVLITTIQPITCMAGVRLSMVKEDPPYPYPSLPELRHMVMGFYPRVKYFVLKDSIWGHWGWEPEYVKCPADTIALAVVHRA